MCTKYLHALFLLITTSVACSASPADRPDSGADSSDSAVPDTTPSDTMGDADADADTDTGSAGTPLVSNAAWSPVAEADDPLSDHRPDTVECPDEAITNEELQGETTRTIDTTKCNYYAAQQSLLGAVEEGDELSVRVWHFDLTYMAPAEAHIALLIDGSIIWEDHVPIPSDGGGLLAKTWEAQADYPVGSTVTLHLHNHGNNTWNFIELKKEGGS